MELNIIVAVDEAGGFGKAGKIPWNIPEDMKHFKETTRHGVCVMGRRTYSDMLEMRLNGEEPTEDFSLLPGRNSYVLTRNEEYETIGSTRVSSIRHVLEKYQNSDRDIFVLGGKRVFIDALSYNPIIHMTIIKGDVYGSCRN